MNGVSESVLDALAGALRLDEAERTHMFDLERAARRAPAPPRRRRHARQTVRPEVQWTLDAITGAAFAGNERLDLLAANELAPRQLGSHRRPRRAIAHDRPKLSRGCSGSPARKLSWIAATSSPVSHGDPIRTDDPILIGHAN
jgi:hypothetical protein